MTDPRQKSLTGLVERPTDDQLRIARAALNPLTDAQRRAVIAVVLYEAVCELAGEQP